MPLARRDGADLVLDVRVQPRASRSEIVGPHGDRIRVRLKAPPVDGRDKRVRIRGAATLPPPYSDWLEPR